MQPKLPFQICIIIGLRIKGLRIQKGLSQERLASIAGVHRTYIGMIERAEKNTTLSNLEKIVKALNSNFEDLFKNL